MAAATGLVITKRFTYRGDPNEEWSNKYWLTGAPPASDVEWETLFSQLAGMETALFHSTCHVVSGYGYADNGADADSVWGIDLTATGGELPGVLPPTPGAPLAGDQACFVWWKTARKTSRGKWIYLRKYFHDGKRSATAPDSADSTYLTALNDFAQALQTGNWVGGRIIRSQAQDEALQDFGANPWVTTRTLKRRGKRP